MGLVPLQVCHANAQPLTNLVDAKVSFVEFSTRARLGETQAQFILGLMYFTGEGTTQNYSKAFEWLNKAHQKGHLESKNYLAAMYIHGQGVAENKPLGMKLLNEAAQAGDPDAIQQLKKLQAAHATTKYSVLDDALLCKGWKEHENFTDILALSYIYSSSSKDIQQHFSDYKFISLSQTFLNQFKAVNPHSYYPEYDIDEGDAPGVGVYLPKQSNAWVKIETFDQHGYGVMYHAYRQGNTTDIKNYLEQRDGIQFKSYNAQQIQDYRTQDQRFDRLRDQGINVDQRADYQKFSATYAGLYATLSTLEQKNKLATQLHIAYTAGEPNAEYGFRRYIYLHDHPTQKNQYILSCGDTEM